MQIGTIGTIASVDEVPMHLLVLPEHSEEGYVRPEVVAPQTGMLVTGHITNYGIPASLGVRAASMAALLHHKHRA